MVQAPNLWIRQHVFQKASPGSLLSSPLKERSREISGATSGISTASCRQTSATQAGISSVQARLGQVFGTLRVLERATGSFGCTSWNNSCRKGTFTIERTQPSAASFGTIRFAEGIKDNAPVNPHKPIDDFKAGTTQVYAFFDAANMTKQTTWKSVWYRDDKQLEGVGGTKTWTGNPSEKDTWLRLFDDKGLTSGTYELKLYIEDRLVQLGTFVIQK